MNWPAAVIGSGLLVACPFCGPLAPVVALGGVAAILRARDEAGPEKRPE